MKSEGLKRVDRGLCWHFIVHDNSIVAESEGGVRFSTSIGNIILMLSRDLR